MLGEKITFQDLRRNVSGQSDDGLSKVSRHFGDSDWAFSGERLSVERTFASDDEVGGGDAAFEFESLCDEIEARMKFGLGEMHQPEAKPSGSSGTGPIGNFFGLGNFHKLGEELL